jgi:transcription elongation factor Elf1
MTIQLRQVRKSPACPRCGDTRIALLKKDADRRDWWLSCHVCGEMWQVTMSSRRDDDASSSLASLKLA